MTDQQPVEAATTTPPQAEKPAEESQKPAPTAESVETEYKARLSGKDKAHAAETATLQAQIDALKGDNSTAASQAKAASTDVETLQKQLAAAQEQGKQQQAQYTAELRSTKYPYAAEALDEQSLAAMDEPKLAGLNARLTPDATPTAPIASSTPAKNAAATKPMNEKTAEELRADLAKLGPQFSQELESRR